MLDNIALLGAACIIISAHIPVFVSAFPGARTGGFDSFTASIPARSADARDRMVATQNNQVARLSWKLEGGSRAPEAGSHIPRTGSPELGSEAVKTR